MEKGSITALLGANGAGKTTTLRALCAMVKTQGEIRFDGQRVRASRHRGHRAPWAWRTCRTGAAPSST
jgi:ABC-type multidrug transport system ATPase subunit